MPLRLAVITTFPIQYFVPVWRELARIPGLETRVHYLSDLGVRGVKDHEFGVTVKWDVPLLDGYDHVFLDRNGDKDNFRRCRIPNTRQLLREGRFDAVFVNGYEHAFEREAVRTARALGLRTVMRGDFTDAPRPGRKWWVRLLRSAYLRRLYREVDAFCYLGSSGRDHLIAHGVPPDRLFLAPYAVDTALLESQRVRWTRPVARDKFGIPDHRLAVLFSGKLIPRKDPLLLVEAVRRTGQAEKLHLIVVGDGPLRGEVETAARSACGSHVTLPGFVNQSELGQYFAAADVFVLPARFDTWGLVVNEAMQFGLPTVVSDGVGARIELVTPGRTGFVFPVGDAEALAGHLRTFLADPQLAARMGAEARTAIAYFTPALTAARIAQAVSGGNADRVNSQPGASEYGSTGAVRE
jgi:glycosyltransferase involved in cell wall biosynthesis